MFYCFQNCTMLRMAYRLTSHHRALFSPKYLSGTSAHITMSSYLRASYYEIKDKDDFEKRVLASSKPVLVDFYAEWCAPCKALTPKLDSVVEESNGLVELAKVDVDTNSDLALEYEVTGLPTVLGIKNGKIYGSFTGLVETEQLRRFVKDLLN